MNKLKSLRRDERGVSLVEVVFAMALFLLIGSVFVFAMGTVAKISGDSNTKAKGVISDSGVSNTFRSDLADAKAVNLVNESALQIAKVDGSCVNWNITKPSGEKSYTLYRSQSASGPAATNKSPIRKQMLSGYFATSPSGISLIFYTTGGVKFSDSANTEVASSDSGGCWT